MHDEMAMIEAIKQLQALHYSQRSIAETLGIDRKTVASQNTRDTQGVVTTDALAPQ